MRGFVILRSDDRPEPQAMRQARRELSRAFDQSRNIADGLWAFFSDDLDLISGPCAFILGQAFGAVQGALKVSNARASAALLVREAWGRYVAVWRDGSVLRSPMGFIDVFTWRARGFQIICSVAPPALDRSLPAQAAIDAAVVRDLIARRPANLGVSPIAGVDTVSPGELYQEGGRQELWTWREHADRSLEVSPRDLKEAVVHCVEAWVGRFPRIVAELSGGLDSAIVASVLGYLGTPPRAVLNYYEPTRGADERAYAAAQAKRLGWPLDCRPKALLDLSADHRDHSLDLRPALARLDAAFDDDAAEALAEVGGQALIGGQGGDAVFFQMPHAWIAADALHADRYRSYARLCANLAEWTGETAWNVAAKAVAGAIWGGRPYATGGASGLAAARSLAAAPAKRLQIMALQSSQLFFGPCARSDAGAVIHPLLSQPLVELCLSISSAHLTDLGRRDRALAREAFKDELAPAIYERRSKGALSRFYARSAAANAESIRDYLADGRLADLGLVQRSWLDETLLSQAMILRRDLSQLLTLHLLERYVRSWERRLSQSRA